MGLAVSKLRVLDKLEYSSDIPRQVTVVECSLSELNDACKPSINAFKACSIALIGQSTRNVFF